MYRTSTSFLLIELYQQDRYDTCPVVLVHFSSHRPCSLPLTKRLIMSNRTKIADILKGYEITKSIISNLAQREYLNALAAGLDLGVDKRVGESVVQRGPCTELLQRLDHRGMIAGLIACKNEDSALGVKKVSLCTQFDPRPHPHRALCKSLCSICRDTTIDNHKTDVITFLRMK